MIRDELKDIIREAVLRAQKDELLPDFKIPNIHLEHPEKIQFGDFSTNIGLVCTKLAHKSPMVIAQSLKIDAYFIEKTEVVNPGFINIYLTSSYLHDQIKEIIKQKDKYGQAKKKKEKVSVEFISANPTGQLHIGHARGAFFGDVLKKILIKAGYDTDSQYYINDAQDSAQIKEFGKTALGKGQTYLNEYIQSKIDANKNKLAKCKSDGEAGSLLAQQVQKDIQDFVENTLKIKFDHWFSEQKDLYEKDQLKGIYEKLVEKDLIYEKDGAQWLKASKYGDTQDWVVVRKSGEYTYLLPDIAYHSKRFAKYDKVINIWGADHQGHVGKIKAAAKMLEYQGHLDVLVTQVVRLKGEKMSKREGKTLTLQWLIDEVGLDAVRFFYLLKSLDSQMEFDMELAKEQSQKNPVYYVQYAYARISSIFKKAEIALKTNKLELLQEEAELNLVRKLIKFQELIEDIVADAQVQHLPYYTMDLANSFHKFYDNCQVLGSDKELSQARLALVKATQIVLKNSLEMLGVSTPEKM